MCPTLQHEGLMDSGARAAEARRHLNQLSTCQIVRFGMVQQAMVFLSVCSGPEFRRHPAWAQLNASNFLAECDGVKKALEAVVRECEPVVTPAPKVRCT